MPLITGIKLGLSADAGSFIAELGRGAAALDSIARSADAAQAALSRIDLDRIKAPPAMVSPAIAAAPTTSATTAGGPAAAGGTDASSVIGAVAGASSGIAGIGAQLRTAFTSALGPLNQIGANVQEMANRVGGTITTLARRIDSHLKFPALETAMASIQQRLRSGMAEASGQAVDSLSGVQRALLALGPAADRGISAFLGFKRITNIFESMGDVARRPLMALSRITFDAPIATSQSLRTSLVSVGTAAQAATGPIRRMGFEFAAALGAVGLVYKATQAVVGFFSKGIQGAADLGETISKTRVILGSSSAAVEAYANDVSARFGLVKQDVLDAASSFGGLGSSLANLDGKNLANFSIAFTQLAADLQSQQNTRTLAEAAQALTIGLSGEQSDVLKRMGVVLNETTVKAYALSHGIAKGKGDLSEYQKVAARVGIIQEKMAKTSGDLARTFDSTKNQGRLLSGTITNLANDVGAVLTPAVDAALGVFGGLALTLAESFRANQAVIGGWVNSFVSGIDAIGGVLRNLPLYGELAWLKIKEGVYGTIAVIEVLPKNLGIVADYLAGNWKELIVDAVKAVWTVFENLGNNIGELWHAVTHVFESGEWSPNFKPLLDGFKATAAELPQLAKPEFVSMGREIQDVMTRIDLAEAARKNATPAAPFAQPPKIELPPGEGDKKVGKYHGTAAVELGSKEAASAIAKFRNTGSTDDKPAQQTAKATSSMDQKLAKVSTTLDQMLRIASGDAGALAVFNL